MRRMLCFSLVLFITAFSFGCKSYAGLDLSKDAEMFRIDRRIVFYNGITDKYILSIEGKCSVKFKDLKFEVTCKTGPKTFKKHYLGRADNVFPFIEQLENAYADVYHHKVIFKPEIIVPDIELSTSSKEN